MTKILTLLAAWLLVLFPAMVAGIGVFAESWARGAFSYRSTPKQTSFGSTEVQLAADSQGGQGSSVGGQATKAKAQAAAGAAVEAAEADEEDEDEDEDEENEEDEEDAEDASKDLDGSNSSEAGRRRRRRRHGRRRFLKRARRRARRRFRRRRRGPPGPFENPYFDVDNLEETGFEYMWYLAGNSLSCMDSCASEGAVCSRVSERKMKEASRSNVTLKLAIGEYFDQYCTKGVLNMTNITDAVAMVAPFRDTDTGICYIPPKPKATCRSNNETVQRLCLCEAKMSDFPSGPRRTAGDGPVRSRPRHWRRPRPRRRGFRQGRLLRRESDDQSDDQVDDHVDDHVHDHVHDQVSDLR